MLGFYSKGLAGVGPTGSTGKQVYYTASSPHLDSTLLFAKHCWKWKGQVLLAAIFYQYTEVPRGSVTC